MRNLFVIALALPLHGCAHTEFRQADLTPVEKAKAQCQIEMVNLAGNNHWWFAPPGYYEKCMQGKGFLPIMKGPAAS